MQNILCEYFKTPLNPRVVCNEQGLKNGAGYFRVGENLTCYGECSGGIARDVLSSHAFDASKDVGPSNGKVVLPFDIGRVIENLRRERYVKNATHGPKLLSHQAWIRECYYFVREFLPVWFRRHLQRAYLRDWETLLFPRWPVDYTVDSLHETLLRLTMIAEGCTEIPFIWFWPDGASSAFILTHDVETAKGRDFCSSLMDIDLSEGFLASFQVVPEKRYKVPESYVDEIRTRGFEFNIHDLNHDGRLFENESEFRQRAKRINEYVKQYNARGFRAGAMYHNLDWYDAFEFSYDMSAPSVAHLAPQRGGCCTVMPFFVGKILELPLTATEDYSMFHILDRYSIDLWKTQIELIRRKHGLISFIVHPDYVNQQRCRRVYESLLAHLRETCDRDGVWATLPGGVDRWWRARSEMKLVKDENGYRIEGPQSERACIAYASLDGDRVVYSVNKSPAMVKAKIHHVNVNLPHKVGKRMSTLRHMPPSTPTVNSRRSGQE